MFVGRILLILISIEFKMALRFVFEFHLKIPCVCCICLWVEASWFWVMSDSKWSFSMSWNLSLKFHVCVVCVYGQIQDGCLVGSVGHIRFFGYLTLDLVWLWISTLNFSDTWLVSRGRGLLILNYVRFKMAIWQLYFFVCLFWNGQGHPSRSLMYNF